MASSRESSPAASASDTGSPQLTPRSKVKKLLASLNDSDDESISGSPRTRVKSIISKNAAKSRALDQDGSASKSQSESEEDEIIRPKGRMAARMQKIRSGSEESAPLSDENPKARVRKTLKAKSKSPSPASNLQGGAESDGSDVPVVARRRKQRVSRPASLASSPAQRAASPGLFVSPSALRSATPAGNASDSDDLPKVKDMASNKRFMALVAEKRAEREAKEALVAKEKAALAEKRRRQRTEDDNIDDDDEEEVDRRLSQRAPARKASKRALEEMHRETQRLSRNQQLTHNATTKKKFPKSGLFALFNYNPGPDHADSASSAPPTSDIDGQGTPPTSPPSDEIMGEKMVEDDGPAAVDQEQEFPTLESLSQIASSPPRKLDKGKGKAIEVIAAEPQVPKKPAFTQRAIRSRSPQLADSRKSTLDDSDSDLEIIVPAKTTKKAKLDMLFDRVPAKQGREAQSVHVVHALASINTSSNKTVDRNKKPLITTSELHMTLQQKARQQAALARREKMEELRARGVIIQTSEEREKEASQMDDMLARARQEGEDIMKREKAAAKKERKAEGEVDPLGESSDDEDWQEEKTAAEELAAGSGSDNDGGESENDGSNNSEDEELEDEVMEVDEDENVPANPMFDEEAGESEEDEAMAEVPIDEGKSGLDDVDEEDEQLLPNRVNRRSRKSNIISDDEESEHEVEINQTPRVPQYISPNLNTKSPIAPTSVLRSATKSFIPGMPVVGVAGLGLTQIFAGTMDESQENDFEGSPTSPAPTFQEASDRKDSMAFLKRRPAPELPPFIATLEEDTQDSEMISQSQNINIPESQSQEPETQGINFNFSQSQFHGYDSLVEDNQSQFPEATQDVGFQHMTPIKGRFVDAPPSTVDTLVLEPTPVPETIAETPTVKKKGKLHRRAPVINFSDDEEVEASPMDVDEDDLDISTNLFDVMRKASKKKIVVDEFDKKKSDAKQMVHEQAEESEDEYAGLGGASDDESGGEEDAFVKEMIDDEAGKDADERQLAAFFAERERVNDEKQVEKLYNDISKGMLRRKRGADYDLSDSDDGGQARQRRKRKEFAKMRKALLADERIGKIAENPKKLAFLKAIEDRGSEDDMDFLEDLTDEDEEPESQSQQEVPEVIPASQPTEMGPPELPSKRKFSQDAAAAEPRAPPHLRRTKMGRKPANLSEIRESLSSLIEEPNTMIAPADSDSEDELEIVDGETSAPANENRAPFALRRTSTPIIDRITLKRQSSSTISNSARLAFSVSSAAPGFKVPALLRRATTNSSITSGGTGGASATERTAGGAGGDGIKRGGGKNSGVNYFARESERRAAVVKTEKRREKKLIKGAQTRRRVVGGMLGGGKFE